MSSIVFIHNSNSQSWAVKDNKTGDIKGLISEFLDAGYLVYQGCLIKLDGFLLVRVFDDLSEAQLFFLKELGES